jgi:hypothetical protein
MALEHRSSVNIALSLITSKFYWTTEAYILEITPPLLEGAGGGISAEIIWGKKNEKAKRKRGKCKRKEKKGERKGKEHEKRGSKRVK